MSANRLLDIQASEHSFQKQITQIWQLGDKSGVAIEGSPTFISKVDYIAVGNLISVNIHPFNITVPADGLNYYTFVGTVPTPTEFRTTLITMGHFSLAKQTAGTTTDGVIFDYGLPTQNLIIYEKYYRDNIVMVPLTNGEKYRCIHYQIFTYLRTKIT